MEAKRYKYIGTQEQANEYGEVSPIIGYIFSEYECVGGAKVSSWANHKGLIKHEWEEVVDEPNNFTASSSSTASLFTTRVNEKMEFWRSANQPVIIEGGTHISKSYQTETNQIAPPHYKQGKVECIEAIKSAVVNKTGEEAVLVGNVIKYLWRYESKGGITDVEKAIWYINHLKQLLDENRNKV